MKRDMRIPTLAGTLLIVCLVGTAAAQKDRDSEPTSVMNFLVVKEDNGKPIRNAAVIMHPVNARGQQSRGGLELKTDTEGKTSFDDIPYGKLRVQVLATGFQTFGEDYDVNQARMNLTIKLKRPQGQYSIYEGHPEDKKDEKKDEKNDAKPPATDPNGKPR
jgi:Carboxypeptidase regulatory-like domain